MERESRSRKFEGPKFSKERKRDGEKNKQERDEEGKGGEGWWISFSLVGRPPNSPRTRTCHWLLLPSQGRNIFHPHREVESLERIEI